jgi:hypothetical protein
MEDLQTLSIFGMWVSIVTFRFLLCAMAMAPHNFVRFLLCAIVRLLRHMNLYVRFLLCAMAMVMTMGPT